jgi:hypothetical protein
MSQSVSDPQTVPASEQPTALRFDLDQPITADAMETNADALMNMLFADVDHMLERGVSLPIEEPVVEEPPAPPPQIILPLETILPPKLSPRDLIPQPPELDQPELSEAASESAAESAVKPTEEAKTKQHWSPLWMSVLCSSLLLSAGILSYLFRDQLTQAWLMVLSKTGSQPTPTVAASPTDAKPNENQDFLQYIGRALDRLAQKDAEIASSQAEPSPAASPSPSPNVIERVYVPIYPSAQTPASPSVTVPAPRPAGSTATAKPATPRPAASPSPSPVPNIAAAADHTLIGILELGDRSAALFEVNGTPQRISIGEQIGSSGWTLVSISNQEAIVRRNGEVRSIYVGQKF